MPAINWIKRSRFVVELKLNYWKLEIMKEKYRKIMNCGFQSIRQYYNNQENNANRNNC